MYKGSRVAIPDECLHEMALLTPKALIPLRDTLYMYFMLDPKGSLLFLSCCELDGETQCVGTRLCVFSYGKG